MKAKEKAALQSIAERNGKFFDEELDKLDKWAEDLKNSLEIELKQLDVDIKIRKTEAKKIHILERKVKEQREIKELESKRNELRRNLFQAQDDVDSRKEGLLGEVEARLRQRLCREPIMIIRWNLSSNGSLKAT